MAAIRTFPDEPKLFAKARAPGMELCQSIEDNKQFPEQKQFHDIFRERMSAVVDFKQEYWAFER